MSNSKFEILNIGDRNVCVGGIGTFFHQDGFPIGMSALELSKRGIELSWFHVIKELYYQYNSNDRLFSKIKAEYEDAKIDAVNLPELDDLKKFIYADIEEQREMIFQYLWGCSSQEAIEDKEKREFIGKFITP